MNQPPLPWFIPASLNAGTEGERLAATLAPFEADFEKMDDDCYVHKASESWALSPDGRLVNLANDEVWLPTLHTSQDGLELCYINQGQIRGSDDQGDTSDSELDIDLDRDLAASSSSKSADDWDSVTTVMRLPLGVVLGLNALLVFSGIYGGHNGAAAATYACTHLPATLLATFRQQHVKTGRAEDPLKRKRRKLVEEDSNPSVDALLRSLRMTFTILDNNWKSFAKSKKLQGGASVSCAFLFGPCDDGGLRIICAHVGDSAALLVSQTGWKPLTQQHSAANKSEVARVLRAGGRIVDGRLVGIDRRSTPCTRAIGHTGICGMSAEPSISVHDLNFQEDEFIVLASGGVWASVDFETAVEVVRDGLVDDHVAALERFRNDFEADHRRSPSDDDWLHAVQTLRLTSSRMAAESLKREAVRKGSQSSATVTVVFFEWIRRYFELARTRMTRLQVSEAASDDDIFT
ncbi:MAG: hypothetical protein KVP17_000134 [Porospora cf. gigantea B]|uniref:uncharacterized protein n=1 Tax=Porospora cf. gigantea B TaxID=2853592 RepID=UPI003571B072|nr:MAG: hypothetical protein KVP17_000134 [Porospora cf. gigantea B]